MSIRSESPALRSGLLALAAAMLFLGVVAPDASAAALTRKASVSSGGKQGNGNSAAARTAGK